MKYCETVTIPSRCEQCPWLKTLAGVHDIAEDSKVELTTAIMDGEVTRGLFGMLLDEGHSIEEAETIMAEHADDVHVLNVKALEDLDEHQAAMVGLSEKLLATCETGTYIDPDSPDVIVCMSALAATVNASLHD